MSKDSGCMSGTVIGSMVRFFLAGTQLLIKIILQLILYLGLWIPGMYVLFGVILYYTLSFNPLDLQLEGQLYFSGLAACILCSIIITVRNIIVKPISSIYRGPKTPAISAREEAESGRDEDLNNQEKSARYGKRHSYEIPRPSIYYSIIEEDTLIHEYEDRFEIYKVEENKARLERVEYKNE